MEVLFRIAAIALTVSLLCLLIKRKNAELAMLLSIAAGTVIMMSALRYMEAFQELTQTVRTMLDGGESLLLPVLKCLGCAAVTRIAAELCRDASQHALAAAVQLAGTFCAVGISLPMILAVIKQIGGLL